MPASISFTALQASSSPALQHADQGAGAEADRDTVLKMLNESLAAERACVVRYRRHYAVARSLQSPHVALEFLEHSNEEQEHADQLMERIAELSGVPDSALQTSGNDGKSEDAEAADLEDISLTNLIHEDLAAKRIAITSYDAMIHYLAGHDRATRRMLEGILEVEQAHVTELLNLLDALPLATEPKRYHA